MPGQKAIERFAAHHDVAELAVFIRGQPRNDYAAVVRDADLNTVRILQRK